MANEKRYVTTDKLQADDEMSPKPARDEQAADGSPKERDGDDEARQVPRPATSE
jgi:hypothetical protein